MICRGCRHFYIFAKRLRMKNLSLYILLIGVLLLNSCSPARRAARSIPASGPAPDYALEYINKYGSLAVSEMKRAGVPASITLAQGMLESDYGRSRLATQGNNHFGIKCHSDWSGQKIYHDDNRRGECFRSYQSVEQSYRDHSDFLVNGSRYRDLFNLRNTDYKGWAHGLKKAGYATDPKYPELLIRKIEEYRLWAYDSGGTATAVLSQRPVAGQAGAATGRDPATSPGKVSVPGAGEAAKSVDGSSQAAGKNTPDSTRIPVTGTDPVIRQSAGNNDTTRTGQAPARNTAITDAEEPIKVISLSTGNKTMENNNVEYIVVEAGDTYESLAEKHQLLSWEITRYNDLAPGTPLTPGQVIYLQPKRTKAAQGLSVHTAVAGETMHSISQKYAIKLSSLYKMNLMDEGTECRPGQKLRLR